MAAHATRSSGSRPELRVLQRRAALTSIVAGSARSNANAFGIKSNADQTRMAAWLPNATRSAKRTSPWLHATTSEAIKGAQTLCAPGSRTGGVKCHSAGWMRSGRRGQKGSEAAWPLEMEVLLFNACVQRARVRWMLPARRRHSTAVGRGFHAHAAVAWLG